MNESLNEIVFSDFAVQLLKVILVFAVFYVLSRSSSFIYSLMLKDNSDRQKQFMLRKFTSYTLFIFAVVIALKIFGVDLKVILGAAGVLSLAVGFAAQTSVSNLISGLFLMFERPFVVGDVVEVNGLRGEVLTIDLLSMRMRTMENTLVRVPNETVMKTPVVNFSHFPIRRHDILFTVSYTADLDDIKKILLDLVEQNQYCLEEPEPLFLVQRVGEYFLEIKFGVWGETRNFLFLQSTFGEQMRKAFIQHKIDLPKRSVHVEQKNIDA
ncbi:MAG: mechanosensitive ion channel family protein [Bdellovibrionaceae bacterium]|nr:mechanosensitive ion channel family protein [Pseudobdellovibrionaceae bacterium]